MAAVVQTKANFHNHLWTISHNMMQLCHSITWINDTKMAHPFDGHMLLSSPVYQTPCPTGEGESCTVVCTAICSP